MLFVLQNNCQEKGCSFSVKKCIKFSEMPVSMVIYLESIVCRVFNKLNYKLYLSGTDFRIACDSTFWWLCLKNNCVKHEEYD